MAVRLWCNKEQLEKIKRAKLKVLEPEECDYVIVLANKEQVENILDEKPTNRNN